MNLRHLRHRHRRLRFVLAALLALLFQQVSFAAYACPALGTLQVEAMADCDDMALPDPDAPALCDQHCQRDHVATPDLKPPQVPLPVLPALRFSVTAVMMPPVQAGHYRSVPSCRADPPPAQRFCSLQI